jgi:hypothetical protein
MASLKLVCALPTGPKNAGAAIHSMTATASIGTLKAGTRQP